MHTLTAHEIRDRIKNKELSSVEITKAYLDRIEKVLKPIYDDYQFELSKNNEIDFEEIEEKTVEEKVKAQFVAEGNKASSIKSLNVYVKPEEFSAYYVINGDFTGRVDLF